MVILKSQRFQESSRTNASMGREENKRAIRRQSQLGCRGLHQRPADANTPECRFDDDYEGWGREDDDLAWRLKHAGVVRRPLRFAGLAIHLWHRTRWPDGIPPTEELPNDRLFNRVLETRASWCERGLDAHVDRARRDPAGAAARDPAPHAA